MYEDEDDSIEVWLQRCRERSGEFAEFSLVLDFLEKDHGEIIYEIMADIYINDRLFAIEPDNLVVFLEELFEYPENGEKFMALPFGATAEIVDIFTRMNYVVNGLIQLWSEYPDAPAPDHVYMSIDQFSDDSDSSDEITNFMQQFNYSEGEIRSISPDFWNDLRTAYEQYNDSVFADNVVMFALVHMHTKFTDSRIHEILTAAREQQYRLDTRDAIRLSKRWNEVKAYPLSWGTKV